MPSTGAVHFQVITNRFEEESRMFSESLTKLYANQE